MRWAVVYVAFTIPGSAYKAISQKYYFDRIRSKKA